MFKSYDCDIICAAFGPFSFKVVVNLTAAEDNPSNLVVWDHVDTLIVDDLAKSQTFSKSLDIRPGILELQELFW